MCAALLPDARDLGDTGVLAGPEGARVLLGGHFDTVPAQGNRPGRRDGERVIGLGASDMKGALAVMIELVRDGLPFGALFFGREELPFDESALTPLLARHPLAPELVGDDGADRQRDPRRLPRQHQRDVDVPRRRRALRPAVVRRQRDHARRRGRDRARGARAGAAPASTGSSSSRSPR